MTRPARVTCPVLRFSLTESKSRFLQRSILKYANCLSSHGGSLQAVLPVSNSPVIACTCTSSARGATCTVVSVYVPVDLSLPLPCRYAYQNSPCGVVLVSVADQPPLGSDISLAPAFLPCSA